MHRHPVHVQATRSSVGFPPRSGHVTPTRAGVQGKALFRRAVEAAGVSLAAVARALGVSSTVVERKASDDHDEQPTLRDILRGPASVRQVTARLLLAEDVAGPGLGPLVHVAILSKEIGEVGRTVLEAHADGRLDEDERAHLRREATEARDALDAFLRDLG